MKSPTRRRRYPDELRAIWSGAAPLAADEPIQSAAVIANSKRRWRRAQLIWASTRGTLFMFVSHGGEPHSMTKRIGERLIRERFLRPVRMHGVVAQALNTLDREEAVSPAS